MCGVEITMQLQGKAPGYMHRANELIVWSTKVNDCLVVEDITTNMFNNEAVNVVDDVNLNVVFDVSEPQEARKPVWSPGPIKGSRRRGRVVEIRSQERPEPGAERARRRAGRGRAAEQQGTGERRRAWPSGGGTWDGRSGGWSQAGGGGCVDALDGGWLGLGRRGELRVRPGVCECEMEIEVPGLGPGCVLG